MLTYFVVMLSRVSSGLAENQAELQLYLLLQGNEWGGRREKGWPWSPQRSEKPAPSKQTHVVMAKGSTMLKLHP